METEGTFKIKTESFEGPLDVLLTMIEKRKLLINDISLAQVTDDYVKYVEDNPSDSISETSHFILIASTLLLIKSKSLLPTLQLSEEEEGTIEDLELRLKIYKRVKEAAEKVSERFGNHYMFQKRYVKPKGEVTFAPSSQIQIPSLALAIKSVINALPKIEKLPKAVVRKVMSLDEMMTKLTKRIQGSIQMSFKEFSKNPSENKVEVKLNLIVSFLAMLELVKQGGLLVRQEGHFNDIQMESKDVATPNYE